MVTSVVPVTIVVTLKGVLKAFFFGENQSSSKVLCNEVSHINSTITVNSVNNFKSLSFI